MKNSCIPIKLPGKCTCSIKKTNTFSAGCPFYNFFRVNSIENVLIVGTPRVRVLFVYYRWTFEKEMEIFQLMTQYWYRWRRVFFAVVYGMWMNWYYSMSRCKIKPKRYFHMQSTWLCRFAIAFVNFEPEKIISWSYRKQWSYIWFNR